MQVKPPICDSELKALRKELQLAPNNSEVFEKERIVTIAPYEQHLIFTPESNMVVEETLMQPYHSNIVTGVGVGVGVGSDVDAADSAVDYSKMGRTVKAALLKAQAESRVIVGLRAAIKTLSQAAEGSLFCLMAVPQDGDSATHMNEVLLEAFCYENDIYVIKVDCPVKLSRILGKTDVESCCLIQKACADDQGEEYLNKFEAILVDYCEAFWDAPQHPVVQLPAV